jgi:hypothetical protein
MTCGPERSVAGEGSDGRGPDVSGERIPFRGFSRVDCGLDPELGRMAPLRPFIPFSEFFFFFCFPISDLFLIFCKNASNPIKQIPGLF